MNVLKLPEDIKTLAEALNRGAVAVMPTDTVYGLVARAADSDAVSRVYAAKERSGKPGTVIAANVDQLVALGIKRRYLTAVEGFWPNPLSVVIPADEQLQHIHCGVYSIACRIPLDPTLRELLELTGPLLTSSANKTGEAIVTSVTDARKVFSELVEVYVDGGIIAERASTVIRMVDDEVEVLRQGDIVVVDGRVVAGQ